MKPLVIARNTDKMPREEWLAIRRQYLGASDAAAVCGENRWRSPLAVWLDKVGQAAETEVSEAMEWGIELEEPIARRFAARTGFTVRRSNVMLRHPEYDFMACNLDRWVREVEGGPWGVLEIKNTGEYQAGEWQDEAAPTMYVLQLQHQLAVTGADYGYLAPLIGGQRLRSVRIERDDRLIANLIKIERDFWGLVKRKTPPPIDDSPDAAKVLKWLYPRGEGTTVTIDEDLFNKLAAARAAVADAERVARGYENRVKDILKTADYAVVSGNPKPVVSWRTSTSHVLDTTALEVEQPEIYQRYLKERVSRRFLLKG
jgi:putative phage-type endonuclease